MKKEHGKIRYISTRVSVLTGMILLGLSVIMVVAWRFGGTADSDGTSGTVSEYCVFCLDLSSVLQGRDPAKTIPGWLYDS